MGHPPTLSNNEFLMQNNVAYFPQSVTNASSNQPGMGGLLQNSAPKGRGPNQS